MRRLALLTAAIALTWPVGAVASDVPQQSLDRMGLGAMRRLSDRDGREIRGAAFAFVWSRSFAAGAGAVPVTQIKTSPPSAMPISVSTSSSSARTFALGSAAARAH
jgi:hypothetical protein